MFDYVRKLLSKGAEAGTSEPQPGRRTLVADAEVGNGAPAAHAHLTPAQADQAPQVVAARRLVEGAHDANQRLLVLRKILEISEHVEPEVAIALLRVVAQHRDEFPALGTVINSRLAALGERARQQQMDAAAQPAHETVSTPHFVRPGDPAKPAERKNVLEQLNKQIAVQQWGDVARRLNGLGPEDLDDYIFNKLTYGQLAHIREAASIIGGCGRVIELIDRADPNAPRIAEHYRKYESTVRYARATGDWHFAANRLDQMGDWDITDRLGRLDRAERMKIRETTKHARVLAAIDQLEGTPEERMKALKAALTGERWGEAAERLNGLGDPDLDAYLTKLAARQLAHVYAAAPTAMPGFATRVTDAIKRVDTKAKDVAAKYTKLEQALADSSWTEAAGELEGMGTPDIDAYLKRLDDAQLAALEASSGATVKKRIVAIRTARTQTARADYGAAVRAGNWPKAAKLLATFRPTEIVDDIEALAKAPDGLEKLAYLRAAALTVEDGSRVVDYIDNVGPSSLPAVSASPVTIAVPDVSADTRPLAGLSLENFGGNAKVREFAEALAAEDGERLAGKDSRKRSPGQIVRDQLEDYREGFITTAAWQPAATFGQYAMAWMYETREIHDAQSKYRGAGKGQWYDKLLRGFDKPKEAGALVPFEGNVGKTIYVHPIVNQVLAGLISAGFNSWTQTRNDHGGPGWEPFCVDISPYIATDERGLYRRQPAMNFLRTFNRIVTGLGGRWRACYDDAEFCDYANKELTQLEKGLPSGETGPSVPPKKGDDEVTTFISLEGNQGTKNWHGGFNLHFHFYIIPAVGRGP